jgi:hypothetical protein
MLFVLLPVPLIERPIWEDHQAPTFPLGIFLVLEFIRDEDPTIFVDNLIQLLEGLVVRGIVWFGPIIEAILDVGIKDRCIYVNSIIVGSDVAYDVPLCFLRIALISCCWVVITKVLSKISIFLDWSLANSTCIIIIIQEFFWIEGIWLLISKNSFKISLKLRLDLAIRHSKYVLLVMQVQVVLAVTTWCTRVALSH